MQYVLLVSASTTVVNNGPPQWETVIISVVASLGVITAALAAVFPTVIGNIITMKQTLDAHSQDLESTKKVLDGQLESIIDKRIMDHVSGNAPPTIYTVPTQPPQPVQTTQYTSPTIPGPTR